jgi:hypothetical protein
MTINRDNPIQERNDFALLSYFTVSHLLALDQINLAKSEDL